MNGQDFISEARRYFHAALLTSSGWCVASIVGALV